jgi:hypothetical protein
VTIVAGGTAPYSYTFNSTTNTTGVFYVSAGTGLSYSFTDAKSCGPVTGTVDVNQPPYGLNSAAVTTAITCNGGKATVTIVATGGTAPYRCHLTVLPIQREFYRRICRNWTII